MKAISSIAGAEIEDDTQIYEYAVLVTSTQALLLST
jgi:hypothetical protein